MLSDKTNHRLLGLSSIVVVIKRYLQFMSTWTEEESGIDLLLFVALQVSIERTSSRPKFFITSSLRVTPLLTVTVLLLISLSLRCQDTVGAGLPAKPPHFLRNFQNNSANFQPPFTRKKENVRGNNSRSISVYRNESLIANSSAIPSERGSIRERFSREKRNE